MGIWSLVMMHGWVLDDAGVGEERQELRVVCWMGRDAWPLRVGLAHFACNAPGPRPFTSRGYKYWFSIDYNLEVNLEWTREVLHAYDNAVSLFCDTFFSYDLPEFANYIVPLIRVKYWNYGDGLKNYFQPYHMDWHGNVEFRY